VDQGAPPPRDKQVLLARIVTTADELQDRLDVKRRALDAAFSGVQAVRRRPAVPALAGLGGALGIAAVARRMLHRRG
jgi:hypothetical protein